MTETKTPELPDPQEAFWLELGPAEPEDTAASNRYALCRPGTAAPYPDAGVSGRPAAAAIKNRGRPKMGSP